MPSKTVDDFLQEYKKGEQRLKEAKKHRDTAVKVGYGLTAAVVGFAILDKVFDWGIVWKRPTSPAPR